MIKFLAAASFTAVLAACGTQVSATASPSPIASPSPTLSPEPTADPETAYADAVCTEVVDAIPAIGKQMTPVLDAVFAEDAQTVAREGAKLQLLIGDMRGALDRAPDYPPARRFESRLTASIDLFLQGLEASQEGLATFDDQKLLEATGLWQAGLDSFGEARSEYQLLNFCG